MPETAELAARTAVPVPPAPVLLRGARLHPVTESESVRLIVRCLEAGLGGWVVTMNLDHLRRFEKDPRYAELCSRADLVVADGKPVVWASRLQGTPLPERVTGSSLIWTLSEAVGAIHRSIFLLGGEPGTAQPSAQRLAARYPGLRISGVLCPDYGFETRPTELTEIRETLLRAAPDVVYVALGSPKQEELINRLRHLLPHAWWIGVGVSFSFVSGRLVRAPRWLQALGLEWLHRLFQAPRLLARRYLVDGVPYALLLLAGAVLARVFRRTGP